MYATLKFNARVGSTPGTSASERRGSVESKPPSHHIVRPIMVVDPVGSEKCRCTPRSDRSVSKSSLATPQTSMTLAASRLLMVQLKTYLLISLQNSSSYSKPCSQSPSGKWPRGRSSIPLFTTESDSSCRHRSFYDVSKRTTSSTTNRPAALRL
jgi:hypothetical protein